MISLPRLFSPFLLGAETSPLDTGSHHVQRASLSDPKLIDALRVRIIEQDCGHFTPCWVWQGGKMKTKGYGRWIWNGRHTMAHRVVYELLVGPIPDGLQSDHLCRNTSCVNPDHMEIVTLQENLRRQFRAGSGGGAINAAKTHCKHGHAFTADNIVRSAAKPNKRVCKTCRREHERRRKAARLGAQNQNFSNHSHEARYGD